VVIGLIALLLSVLVPASGLAQTPLPTPPPVCVGDCNGDGSVTVDELLTLVNMALGSQTQLSACPQGIPPNIYHVSQVDVAGIIQAVNNALNGCPVLQTPTPSPTCAPTPTCPENVIAPDPVCEWIGKCPLCRCEATIPIRTVTPTYTPSPSPTPFGGCVESVSPYEIDLCSGGGQACFNITAPDSCCWKANLTYCTCPQGEPPSSSTDSGCGSGSVCYDVPGHTFDPNTYDADDYLVGSIGFHIRQWAPGLEGYCPPPTPAMKNLF
jgi:hypothetical protein